MGADFLQARFPAFIQSVNELSTEGFWFILAALLIASVTAFYFIWRNLHRARLIEDTPTARIRSAHQGYLEIEGLGRLLDGPPIVGPLTGIHCLWYRYKIEHREAQRGRNGSTWSTLQSGVSEGLFAIEDATGRCIIDPDGAEVISEVSDVWYGQEEFPRQAPPRSKSWLRLAGGDYRYTEERLMPGSLYVLGWFGTVRNQAGDMHAEVSLLLREWKADQVGLLRRFDRNADGQIDAGEWDTAREVALQEVIRLRSHRPQAADSHMLSRSPSDRHPFLISAISQQQLASRYRRRALLALVTTFAGVAAALLLVSARLLNPG